MGFEDIRCRRLVCQVCTVEVWKHLLEPEIYVRGSGLGSLTRGFSVTPSVIYHGAGSIIEH